MDALTPARPALRPSPGDEHRLLHAQVSLIHALDLPTLPSPTTCAELRLARARYPSADRTEIASPRVFSQRELGASPLHCRLATSHRPNRVSYRTDWSFTPCCSPPRVTTTQLQSITSYVDLERTFTPPVECATSGAQCGSSSYRLPPEVHTERCMGREKAVAAATALQGFLGTR